MFKKIFVFLGLVALGYPTGSSLAAEKQTLAIGTGSKGGAYYPIGRAICKLTNKTSRKSGIACKEQTTAGSIFNLNGVQQGKFQLAIAQSDWQHHSYKGTSKFKSAGANKNLRSLFALHSEPFSIIVRAKSGISDFNGLAKRRVNIGEPGSGHRGTLDAVLGALKWNYKTFSAHSQMPLKESARAFCNGSIDAMVLTVGHPSKMVKDLTQKCNAVLVGIAGKGVERMIKSKPYYSRVSIRSGTYKNMMRNIQTLGLSATLVSSSKVSKEAVYTVVKSVFKDFKKFKNAHQALKFLDMKEMISHRHTAPLHPGAVAYYKEAGLM